MKPPRRDAVFFGALGLSAFAVYFATCGRTVTGEDCGELVAAAYTLGVAHPPGYPLWTLLAKLFTWIPAGEIAFRVALLSAACGAATVVVLGAVALRLARSYAAATAAALGFGLLRDQWSQAVIAEVYTLNTLLLALCLLLLLRWDETKGFGRLRAFAVVYGLSLTNHPLQAGLAPALLAFLLLRGRRLLGEVREIGLATVCFLAGLVPYAYLPLAALRSPAVNWGDPSSWSAFVDHVLRRQYVEAEAAAPAAADPGRTAEQYDVLWTHATGQSGTWLLALGLVGALLLLRRRFAAGVLLLGVVLSSTAWLISVLDFDTDFENAHANRLFFVPAYLAASAAAAVALAAGARRVARRFNARTARRAEWVVAAAIVVSPLTSNWATCDYANYRVVAEYGRRMIESVAWRAIVFPTSDHQTFPLLYLKYVEGRRPDVTLGDKYGYVDRDIWGDAPFAAGVDARTARTTAFRRRVEAWLLATTDRPVYFTRKHALPREGRRDLGAEGLYERAWREADVATYRKAAADAAWAAVEAFPLDEDVRPYDFSARMILGDACFADARRRFSTGDVEGGVRRAVRGAEHALDSKEVQNNHGALLAEHGRVAEAEPLLRRATALDPHYRVAARNLAAALRVGGRLDEAEEAWTSIHLEDPKDVGAVLALADLARDRKRWIAAADFCERGGEMTGDPRLFRDAGLIRLFELNQLARAKALLETSLRLDPNQPEIRDVAERVVARKDPREAARMEPERSSHAPPRASDDPQASPLARTAAGLRVTPPDPRGRSTPPKPSPAVPQSGIGAPTAPLDLGSSALGGNATPIPRPPASPPR